MDAPAAVLLGSIVNASCVAAPGAPVNAALVVPVTPVALAASVYPPPALLMLSPGNVATPPAAATAVVPESVPPPGFAPIASVTVAMKAVAVLPCASCAVTWTAGAIDAPAVALDGWTESTRRVAAPAPMLNGALGSVASPLAATVSV